jgi:protein TonB
MPLRNLFYLRFFAVSIALHGILLLMAYPLPLRRGSAPELIPVSILPPRERELPPVAQAPKMPPARARNLPAVVARKDSPRAQPKADRARSTQRPNSEAMKSEPIEPVAPLSSPPPQPSPAPREVLPERTIVAERPLPTIKELLPPANWSSRSSTDAPVNLNTNDPIYVSYFNKVKQLIEAHWEYPELALRYGLQGRLSLEFTIGPHGQLERARVIRSSGSQLLDDEALRAIKAAAPFPPIPPWVKPNPLSILAAMEYHDNRVNYQFAR